MLKPVKETSNEPEIIPPASSSGTPTPSLEDDDDEFDDGSDEFSFYKFSILHFQGNATHTHIPQRLKQPLLRHDDEGDALVRGQRGTTGSFLTVSIFCQSSPLVSPLISPQACLTVFWIIQRFMGDMPEPKSQDVISVASSTISRNLPQRQARRLSHLVGLDQVT